MLLGRLAPLLFTACTTAPRPVCESAATNIAWFLDADGDGFGDPAQQVDPCKTSERFVANATDCNDGDPAIHPLALEICDAALTDEDCDGAANDHDDDVTGRLAWYPDDDGDGFGNATGPTVQACAQPPGHTADRSDCDDANPGAHPAAVEVCDPADVDEDCDGYADDLDDLVTGLSTWYVDADGDGFGDAGSGVASCDRPLGHVAVQGDCDDADWSIHPSAQELCDDDDVDEDCDGAADDNDDAPSGRSTWYRDDDGDTYGDAGATTEACDLPAGFSADDTDCDDTDPEVHPGAPESHRNDIDDDCDGRAPIGFALSAADAKLVGQSSYDYAGYSVAGAGDVNADGFDDLLVGAREDDTGAWTAGTAYLVLGPVSGAVDLAHADAKLVGTHAYGFVGTSVSSAGDLNGDGFADLVVGGDEVDFGAGMNRNGAVYVFLGPVSGSTPAGLADATLGGVANRDYAGRSVAGAGDVDGDGFDDLLIGAYGVDSRGAERGAAYLVRGPTPTAGFLTTADARLTGEANSDYAGWSVSGAGDVNGDGLADLLIGAYAANAGGWDEGAAYLVHGPVSGLIGLASADAVFRGEASWDNAGYSVSGAGDVNGDGLADLVIGAPYHGGAAGYSTGAAYVLLGPGSSVGLAGAEARLEGSGSWDNAGGSVSDAGDVNQDGFDDVLIGANNEGTTGWSAGAVYLAYGPLMGTLDLAYVDVHFVGESSWDYAGQSVASAGDVDADGLPDLLMGAHQEGSGGWSAGAAYLVLGSSL